MCLKDTSVQIVVGLDADRAPDVELWQEAPLKDEVILALTASCHDLERLIEA